MEYLNRLSSMSWPPLDREALILYLKQHPWQVAGTLTAGYVVYKLLSRPRNLPPGPRGLPLIGAMLHFSEDIHDNQLKLKEDYGDIASYYMGSQLNVNLNSAELIREAFVKRADEFNYRASSLFTDLMGWKHEIATLNYGEEWKKAKRLYVSALRDVGFGPSSAEGKIQSEVEILLEHLEKNQEKAGEEGVSISEPLATVAANFICSIAFSEHYEQDEPALKELRHLAREAVNYNFLKLMMLDFLPTWFCRLTMSGLFQELPARVENLRQYIVAKVKEHDRTRTPGEPRDFIDKLLEEKSKEGNPDYEIIADACALMLPDSFDNMPLAVEWLILYITKHPEVQAKIHNTIDEVIGKEGKPSLSDKAKMPYLDAVVQESLRLSVPVPILPYHSVNKNVTLAGYNIPKDTVITGNISAVHYNPEVFPEPDKFKPERFLDEDGKLLKGDLIYPFGLGPRSCVGQQLVKLEMFLTMVNLFQKFNISFSKTAPEPSTTPVLVAYLRKPQPFKIVLKRR